MNTEELELLLKQPEGAHLEFKTARNRFNEDTELPDYCAALANEKGGKLLLGVDNKGYIVGTNVFRGTINTIPHEIFSKLKLRVEVEELLHPKGRVIIFSIPSRPTGHLIRSTGKHAYPMRVGESLTEMDQSTIKRILNETEEFTSTIVPNLKFDDLDSDALRALKQMWSAKSERKDFLRKSDKQMLHDLSLMTEDQLTYASLIIAGKQQIIQKYLPGAEIILEWRDDNNKIAYDFRKTWRDNFLSIIENIWKTISTRNVRIPIQEGFVQRDIWAFDEKVVRETVLNAVAHRDYAESARSVFIKISPHTFFIESPGGLIPPVTVNNIMYNCAWRNRLLAETFEKAGLVERLGQGVDDIFERTLRAGKGKPDFSGTDDTTVRLTVPAKVQDAQFILYLEKIAKEKNVKFTPDEILELERVRVRKKIKRVDSRNKFLHLGIVENIGRGKGSRYILSHRYYIHEGRPGIHTRMIGTNREEKKILILKHFKRNNQARLADFQDIFPDLSKKQVQNLLQELRSKQKLEFQGSKKFGFWHEKHT